jgi:hypothetical protein
MAIAENYEEVLKGKYPAKEHAKKVKEWLVSKGGDKNGTIYLEAQKQKLNEDNDGEAPFRYGEHDRTKEDHKLTIPLKDSDDTFSISVVASSQTHISNMRWPLRS